MPPLCGYLKEVILYAVGLLNIPVSFLWLLSFLNSFCFCWHCVSLQNSLFGIIRAFTSTSKHRIPILDNITCSNVIYHSAVFTNVFGKWIDLWFSLLIKEHFFKVAEFMFQHQARVIYVCSEYVISSYLGYENCFRSKEDR